MVSQVKERTDTNVGIIKTLVALLPLLGLLGTVTGMIEVFDVMALSGSSNARLMAGGVFKATIPTMAGMTAALSGLYFSTVLPHIPTKSTPAITVYVDARDQCSVDGEGTTCDRVSLRVERLLADKPGASVILRLDEGARHELLVGMTFAI